MQAQQLQGRVFSRLQQFAALSVEIQDQVKELEVYLANHHTEIFELHHANLVKTVRSVRANDLLAKIDTWLNGGEANANAHSETVLETTAVIPRKQEEETLSPFAAAALAEDQDKDQTEQATSSSPTTTTNTNTKTNNTNTNINNSPGLSDRLLEGLVLHGFMTPYKEHDKHPSPEALASPSPFTFKGNDLFVSLAPDILGNVHALSLTVWNLVDGAVFATLLKRKTGLLTPLTHGKPTYVVLNDRVQSLTLFKSDVGREPLAHFQATESSVSFDNTLFVDGVKIWNNESSELINGESKQEAEAFVHALATAGFQYKEDDLELQLDQVHSFYDLQDTDIDGNQVHMAKYKGKVVLVVNVASDCGLAEINYPQLVLLQNKYKAQGLEILAFPCDQFACQEPGTNQEIKASVSDQFNATFSLFAKSDVNGTHARPVFRFLKSKVPSVDGSTYIRWNFTKFLIDRNGQPVKRYAPTQPPLAFELEITGLLFAMADNENENQEMMMATTPTKETTTAPHQDAIAMKNQATATTITAANGHALP